MSGLAPGSILQRMYLKERLNSFNPKTFCEIGSGNGILAKLFLSRGMKGVGYDLNAGACANNNELNLDSIASGNYNVYNENFLSSTSKNKYDLIISCMVIEHLDEETVNNYFEYCKNALSENGRILVLVPSSMRHWGIEDEIAGHFKRYEFEDFNTIAEKHNLQILNVAGLTYPISNWLLGLSNYVVKKNEGHKKNISMQEQTVESGNRKVKYKTDFPAYFGLIFNSLTLLPFHVLQKINKKNSNSLVMYCEFGKK